VGKLREIRQTLKFTILNNIQAKCNPSLQNKKLFQPK
jgi:hypothetical protein